MKSGKRNQPQSHPIGSGVNSLKLPVNRCRGVGPKISLLLAKLEIGSIEDLLHHFPRSYLDRRQIIPITSLQASSPAVVSGEVVQLSGRRPSRRFHITQCVIRDHTGSVKAVWFNQPYMFKALSKGKQVILSGLASYRNGYQLENPDLEVVTDEKHEYLHTLGMIPVYPLTEGLGQKTVRRLLKNVIDDFLDVVPERLPEHVIHSHALSARKDALRAMHFPESESELTKARRTLAFEEFTELQVNLLFQKTKNAAEGVAFTAAPNLTRNLDKRLPFRLTSAQEKAVQQIFRQMESPKKMNILLQGDVGSGKTIVVVYAMLKALDNGKQAVLMAPTEILAEQHFARLRRLGEGLRVPAVLLTAGRSPQEKKETLRIIQSGTPCLIAGTHALLADNVSIPNAGLVIIDEQHRFGVNQRASLIQKGINPDLIVMTATPIPRTLALIFYGEFDIVLIDEYPQGRIPVQTVLASESERAKILDFLRKQLEEGRQAFVVCPEIGDASAARAAPANVRKALQEYSERLPQWRVERLHGRMPLEEREDILNKFRNNLTQVLITTTIIEVGVDVPNASMIIIEGAERFGLTQLHQLRGRVGRSGHKSHCFLFAESLTPQAEQRLAALKSSNDGFKIAEQDLLLRGPGEFLGTAQSGAPLFRVGHLVRDERLLHEVRQAISGILKKDPLLQSPANAPLRAFLKPGAEKVNL